MSTLQQLAEAAVRRDLHRARVVLTTGARITPERRLALCDLLDWMADLVGSGDPMVDDAAAGLRAAVRGFRVNGERPRRLEVLRTLGSLHRVTNRRDDWISDDALRALAEHVPWLFDGAARHGGSGLVLDAGERLQGRARAEAYRRRRLDLWGAVALATPDAPVMR